MISGKFEMPELPDVELQKRYFDRHALNRTIRGVSIASNKVLDGIPAQKLAANVPRRRFESSRRRGKWLYARLDSGKLVLFHFGMTGRFVLVGPGENTPDYARVVFAFKDGARMAFVSVRQLGRVGMAENEEEFLGEKKLGPDAYSVDRQTFRQRIGGRKAPVKTVLMNQKVMAGIGNVYADEILFQAKIDPQRRANELSEKELNGMFRAAKRVFDTAVKKGADARRLPQSFLIHHRHEGGKCPRCGGGIEPYKTGGRRGWFCPSCQR